MHFSSHSWLLFSLEMQNYVVPPSHHPPFAIFQWYLPCFVTMFHYTVIFWMDFLVIGNTCIILNICICTYFYSWNLLVHQYTSFKSSHQKKWLHGVLKRFSALVLRHTDPRSKISRTLGSQILDPDPKSTISRALGAWILDP